MSNSTPYLKRHDNGTYYVHWTESGVGKRVSTRSKALVEAQRFLGTWLLMEREAPAPVGVHLTIDELWPVYFTRHVVRGGGQATAGFTWKNLQPFFGAKTVPEVSQMACDNYVQKRVSGHIGRPSKPQTCRRELSTLFACLRFCSEPRHKQKLFPVALIDDVTLPADGAPRDRWLRDDEVKRLLNAAAARRTDDRLSRIERFLWIALETGARKQAIRDLTWDRVDFDTRVIHLAVPGARMTKKRRASVPISNTLLPVLRRAYSERTNDVVLDHKGEVWAGVQSIVRAAGLAPAPRRGTGQSATSTGVGPNTLRHTAATHMARRGVPLWKIAKILGNTLAMVEKVYAKHCPDDLREAVNLISKPLEAAE